MNKMPRDFEPFPVAEPVQPDGAAERVLPEIRTGQGTSWREAAMRGDIPGLVKASW